jgi:glucose/arabinose dehydrogenase
LDEQLPEDAMLKVDLQTAPTRASSRLLRGAAAALACALAAVAVPSADAQRSREDPAALPEQQVGQSFSVKPQDLPAPFATASASNGSSVVPYRGQTLRVPEGFTAQPFATGLSNPRRLLVLPNGDVIVTIQDGGEILRLHDHDGHADAPTRVATGFDRPYGLAWRNNELLVVDQQGIWSVPEHGAKRMLTARHVFGAAYGHENRSIAIDPKTGALFISVGSMGNVAIEPPVKATIQRFDADGKNQATFATGMRNPTALAFNPDTGDLFATVQERDDLGDRLVPDYLTRVAQGAFYGWPYAYIGPNPQPKLGAQHPDKVKAAVVPDLLFEAHSALLDLVFYTADQFPAQYRGSAFVALHGSWNRAQATGYKIVRVPFRNGQPEGSYENFATGFWVGGLRRAEVWGRPAALAVAKDGALLVADDTGGTIWRIAYTGKK